jgi:ATP-binding cassette, subfamily B, multidrug efflux pump
MMGMDGGRRFMEQDVLKPKNVGVTLRRFSAYFKGLWGYVLTVVALVVVVTWAQVTAPDLIGQAIDCYLYPRQVAGQPPACWYTADSALAIDARVNADASIAAADKQTVANNQKISGLLGLVLLISVIFVAVSLLNGVAFLVMGIAGQSVLKKMRIELFAHIHKLSLNYYAKNETGNIMSRLTNDTDTIAQTLNFILISVAGGILLLVWIAIRMVQTNAAYALVSLAVVPLMLIATLYFSSQARKAYRKTRTQMGSVNADLQESIAGVRESQAFAREDENIREFERLNAANRDANIRAASFTSALTPVLEALGYIAIGIVVLAGGLSVINETPILGSGVITLGTVFVFVQYIQRFNQPVQQIAVFWTSIQSAVAGAERIFALLDETADIQDSANAKPMPAIKGDVEFAGVRAEYVKGEPVLRGVDLQAKAGQVVAIVGPTGAGKTTIINLIPRFYDVTGGAVKIDGHDVREVTMESLRKQVGIVLQDSFLFADTILNNIRYGRLDATDEEVIAAAKLVAADTFIERLPEQYNTVLGERGSGLSQGQRQLLSIARAALKDPRILILDEATSSVDTRTERLIQKALETLLRGRTSFVVAHRLSTIRNANMVLYVKAGEILERGTHDELLALKGHYYDLYMSQFKRAEEAGLDVLPNTSTAYMPTPAGD